MTTVSLMGLCASALVGLGLFGTFFHRDLLRRVVAFNLVGAGVFLFFGVVARRGALHGSAGSNGASDPVPQAMVITGIVVAFAGTALALAFARRLFELSGRTMLPEDVEGGLVQSDRDQVDMDKTDMDTEQRDGNQAQRQGRRAT